MLLLSTPKMNFLALKKSDKFHVHARTVPLSLSGSIFTQIILGSTLTSYSIFDNILLDPLRTE